MVLNLVFRCVEMILHQLFGFMRAGLLDERRILVLAVGRVFYRCVLLTGPLEVFHRVVILLPAVKVGISHAVARVVVVRVFHFELVVVQIFLISFVLEVIRFDLGAGAQLYHAVVEVILQRVEMCIDKIVVVNPHVRIFRFDRNVCGTLLRQKIVILIGGRLVT